MPKLTIDGTEIEVEDGLTVLQACEQAGAEVPRFCYHERLSIAGNCRMCLVEMERAPKPVASCAMPVGEGMVITTNSEKVRKMRENVMEFLLINHPLDCPICDQGGECDLQDQAVTYGKDRGRFDEMKRAVPNKDFGPLVKGVMTRCIHCTRCVRFITDIAGTPELGGVFRSEHLEIDTYVDMALTSELSGNIIDLCPVGALTSKPYAFKSRPWELKKTESIDVMDGAGSAIRVDTRGAEVMRVLPRLNEDINEEWISDKTRFACDGLSRQRLDTPYVRENGKLVPASWDEAFSVLAKKFKGVKGDAIAAIAGDQADVEAMTVLKDLMTTLNSPNIDCRSDGGACDPGVGASYRFNTTIAGIEQADAILIIGSNPRVESPVINARIRKRYLQNALPIGVIGPDADLTYTHQNFGDDPAMLADVAEGNHPFAKVLKKAKNPMLIIGAGALSRSDGQVLLGLAHKIASDTGMISDAKGDTWNGFNVLQTAASRVGGLDIGFVPDAGGMDAISIIEGAQSGEIEIVYLLGADEIDTNRLGDAFVVYQGHHGDNGAHRADVILPGAAYTEKNATFVNTEGRVQQTRLATFPPGEAKEDWAILRKLSDVLGHKLSFESLVDVRERMAEINDIFETIDEVKPQKWKKFGGKGEVNSDWPLRSHIRNFYMTDPISRTSETMARCTAEILGQGEEGTGTDG
ncbi:MAG: NADH-quinone oxidoreductase subunit G [Rhodospirillaceae bacterium]|nr:NADH-quinone oxidoreductase subunit G [Rhodospirillaceae bacterium]